MKFIKTKHCLNHFVPVISSDCFHTLVNGQQEISLDFLYLELSNKRREYNKLAKVKGVFQNDLQLRTQ